MCAVFGIVFFINARRMRTEVTVVCVCVCVSVTTLVLAYDVFATN